jgi:xanthine phosphoribosyltransferase
MRPKGSLRSPDMHYACIGGGQAVLLLKQRIMSEGRIIGQDILKVDSFLNHQIDIRLYNEIGKEFKARFSEEKITKILTIEASGIGIACITAQYFDVPVVFAKKTEARNLDSSTYESEVYSFTRSKAYKVRVSKNYLGEADQILVIDDFLANGNAVNGLMDIIGQAGARLAGVGIVIEKGFQDGGRLLRDKGVRVESLAVIKSMADGRVEFL